MKMKYYLAIIFSIFSSNSLLLAKEITLVIQVDDTTRPFYDSSNSQYNYVQSSKLHSKLQGFGLKNLTILHLSSFDLKQEDLSTKIINLKISNSDTITKIIIAAQAHLELDKNITNFPRLGSFSKNGVTGHLDKILQQISPKLGKNLHIFVDACAALCGTDKQIKNRFRGLRNTISSYTSQSPIKQLSLAGSTFAVASNQYSQEVEFESIDDKKAHEIFNNIAHTDGMITRKSVNDYLNKIKQQYTKTKYALYLTTIATSYSLAFIYGNTLVDGPIILALLTPLTYTLTRYFKYKSNKLIKLITRKSQTSVLLSSSPVFGITIDRLNYADKDISKALHIGPPECFKILTPKDMIK